MFVGLFARTAIFSAFITLALSFSPEAQAGTFNYDSYKLNIKTAAGTNAVFAEIHRGSPGQPVFVLINGLIYDHSRWDGVADRLISRGATVIRYAFSAQPESLRLVKAGQDPEFFTRGLALSDLADELHLVLNQLGVNTRVNIVGLSYGASVAAEFAVRHEARIDNLVFIAPLVVPLETYDWTGRYFRQWLNSIRFWENAPCDFYGSLNPFLCSAQDYWFDSFYNAFYATYLYGRIEKIPDGIESQTFKKSVFHLVRASRDFDLRTYAPKLKNVHLILSSADESNLLKDQEEVWQGLNKGERLSLVVVKGGAHALPDASPQRTADLLLLIGDHNPDLTGGHRFEVPGDN